MSDVKPDGHVENYLEPLTGLNKALIEQHGVPLEQVGLHVNTYRCHFLGPGICMCICMRAIQS